MLCSKCSSPVRPIVVFDIDGTLGDYHRHFWSFVARYWDRNGIREIEDFDGRVEFEDFLGLTKEQYREAKLAYRQGGSKRWMPCYEESAAIVAEVRTLAEVWICTTRPWQRLDNIDPDTREWLRRNEIHIDGILYGDTKYEQLVETVDPIRITAVVEDLPDQFWTAKNLGLPVILRENHHNAHGGKVYPRGSLAVCGAWAMARAEQWIERYRGEELHVHN